MCVTTYGGCSTKKDVKSTRHRCKDKFMGGHHRQRIVDEGKMRTLISCGRCLGWASEHKGRQAFEGR